MHPSSERRSGVFDPGRPEDNSSGRRPRKNLKVAWPTTPATGGSSAGVLGGAILSPDEYTTHGKPWKSEGRHGSGW
jgi:hypothetical protein